MTVPLPADGDTSWSDWASQVHGVTIETVMAAVSSGNTAAQNTAALNAAIATGKRVLIKVGTFNHEGFTMPAAGGPRVEGMGRGITELINTHATNASVTAHGVGGGGAAPYCQDWSLSDLTLSASAVRAGQVGVSVLLANRFSVENVTVIDHGVGIRNKAGWEGTYNTVTAYNCTTGWDFPAISPHTVSAPLTVTNGSAIICGTGMISDGSVESLTWTGGDLAGCGTGVKLLGDATRNVTFTGLNFEGITGDDVVMGDATTAPSGANFVGCRFFRASLVGGSQSVNYVRGAGLALIGCSWNNYATAIAQSGNTGSLTVVSPSGAGVTTFLDSNGVMAPLVDLAVPTPRKIMRMDPRLFAATEIKAWGDTGTVGPFACTFTITLDSFTSTVGHLVIGGAQYNNSVNRVAYAGMLLISAKDNAADAWAVYVTATGTPVGLAAGPTVAISGTGTTRTLTVTFTASNNDVYGGSCAVILAPR